MSFTQEIETSQDALEDVIFYGWLWSQQLELYLGIYESQLRWFTVEGQLVPTHQGAAEQERQQKEQAQQQLLEMESLLARYREQFGELPE